MQDRNKKNINQVLLLQSVLFRSSRGKSVNRTYENREHYEPKTSKNKYTKEKVEKADRIFVADSLIRFLVVIEDVFSSSSRFYVFLNDIFVDKGGLKEISLIVNDIDKKTRG